MEEIKPNTKFQILVNQGYRDARVLAVCDGEVLIEYEMPKGTTSLRIVDAETIGCNKNVAISYWNIPLKWLRKMVSDENDWSGNPQQFGHKQVPGVGDMLTLRQMHGKLPAGEMQRIYEER